MADADANRAHLVTVDEGGAIGVGRQSVQVGPLGQIIRVAQAVAERLLGEVYVELVD